MNNFGGDWTKIKIEILVEYAKAYLNIMKDRKFFKLMYFDGFAGSGFIVKDKKVDIDITVGAARRIIEISVPRPFDSYYFVEKDPKNFALLEENTKNAFPDKTIYTKCDDCNKKIIDLANFLRDPKNKNVRTLAYVDPCGMQVEWRSIESLRGLPLDMWILVPTGLGVNRLLKKNGQISDAWLEKLEIFLGLSREEIEKRFYKKTATLFEDITFVLGEGIKTEDVTEEIKLQSFLIREVSLKDQYENAKTFHIIYQAEDRNLTNIEIVEIREGIIKAISEKFEASVK